MPTKGQKKRWFWRCTLEHGSGPDYEVCLVGCRKRDGFPSEAEAFAAGRRRELEYGGHHRTTTWSDYVKPIKKVKTKAQPSKKKRALLDLIATLKSVFEQSAVLACWEDTCDGGPNCLICEDMKKLKRLLKVLGDMA